MAPARAQSSEGRGWFGLSPTVIALCWVSFFQDAASEMLYPVLPIFLRTTLGAPVAVVGLVEGLAEGTASVVKALAGRLADRVARKPLIFAGYGTSSLSKLAIAAATTWPLVLVCRVVDRVGKGVRGAPRDALLVAAAPPQLRGRAFGLHRAADTAGAVIGPLIGLALYEMLDHRIRPLFLVAFVPAALSVAAVAFVKETGAPPKRAARTDATPGHPASPLPRPYLRVAAFLTLFGLVNFPDALLILRARALGLSFVSVLLAYSLYNLSYAALSVPAGTVSDRFPRRFVVATGLGCFAVAYLGLGIVTRSGWVWPLLVVYGGYTALTDGVAKAWVADLLPRDRIGTGLGLFQGLTGGAVVVAGIWAGLAWHGSGRLPLCLSGAVAACLAITLVALPVDRVEDDGRELLAADEEVGEPGIGAVVDEG